MRTISELIAAPARKWDEILHGVRGVFVIPNGLEHDSGWMCMDFVAEFANDDNKLVKFGGGCDAVTFEGSGFRMDCTYPDGIVHIWNRQNFSVSNDCSSIYFREEVSND